MEHVQGEPGVHSLRLFIQRSGIEFIDLSLVKRALTHSSYYNEHPEVVEDNERLEFLGDAVIDFIVADWLYNRFPELEEGQLTRLRSALVGNRQLAEYSKQIGLGDFLFLGKGEHESGGRGRVALLGSGFEAILGAIFLDQGIDIAKKFVIPFFEDSVQGILAGKKDLDPKNQLQEWSQAQDLGTPIYRTVKESGPDHQKLFVVEVMINGETYAIGEGSSKQAATKKAARNALNKFGL